MPMFARAAKLVRLAFAWVVVPAGLLALAFAFRAGMLAVTFYALFIIILISSVMTFLWLRPIKVERELSDDVVRIGEKVKVTVKLTNSSFLPILWMYAEETLPKKMPHEGTIKRLLIIPPKRNFHLTYSLTLTRRGCHAIGPIVLETGDVFGLYKRTRIDRRRDFVTVLPPYDIIEEYQVGQERKLGGFAAARSIFEDPTRIRGVREYRRGDAMKRIHWKSTARRGELVSKIFDPVIESGATVVLDFHKESWKTARSTAPERPPEEMGLELACTVCRYLTDGGWRVGFFSNGRDPLSLPGITIAQAKSTDSLSAALHAARMGWQDDRLEPIAIRAKRGPEQFDLIHENLGRLEMSDGLRIESLLMEELPHIERQQALVIVTADVTDAFIGGVLRARQLGYRVMVFVVCHVEGHNRAFDAFTPHGIEVYRMDEDWRLKEIAAGRRSF